VEAERIHRQVDQYRIQVQDKSSGLEIIDRAAKTAH
jgi:hypothetical protein